MNAKVTPASGLPDMKSGFGDTSSARARRSGHSHSDAGTSSATSLTAAKKPTHSSRASRPALALAQELSQW